MSDLTAEQIQRIIANHESGIQLTGVAVYRQLLALMQREERLKKAMVLAVLPLEAMRLCGIDKTFTPDMQAAIDEAIVAVRGVLLNATQKESKL